MLGRNNGEQGSRWLKGELVVAAELIARLDGGATADSLRQSFPPTCSTAAWQHPLSSLPVANLVSASVRPAAFAPQKYAWGPDPVILFGGPTAQSIPPIHHFGRISSRNPSHPSYGISKADTQSRSQVTTQTSAPLGGTNATLGAEPHEPPQHSLTVSRPALAPLSASFSVLSIVTTALS
jgi:hypothetical protein